MKRLIIWLALLLPFIANAQVNGTIQKTASSGTIRGAFGSLGIDTIPRVTGALVNGYILKYHAATNKWYASPDPTLVGLQDSLTKKANRTFDNVASGAIAKAKADTSATGLQTVSNFFPKGDTRWAKIVSGTTNYIPKISGANTLANSPMQTGVYTIGFGISPTDDINVSIDAAAKIKTLGAIESNQSVTAGTLMQSPYYTVRPASSSGDIKGTNLTANRVFELPNASGTFLLENGSGSGLSGIAILNGTNSFTSTNTFTNLNINRPATSGSRTLDFRTGGSPEWYIGNYLGSGSTTFDIVSYNGGTPITAMTINSGTGAIAAAAAISSTPQGTLYGTASGSITSAQLATSLTDETGTGNVVFSANPTFTGTIAAAAAGFTGAVNLATSSGNVLIGTTTDGGFKLDVNGTARFSGLVTGNGGFRSTSYQLFQASAQRGGTYTYDAIAGSGTDYNPTFYSEGDLYFATGGTATKKLIISSAGAATFSSSVTATGFFESSDLRYKDILSREVSKDGFDMISYKWKPELNRNNKVHFGYVAQEVEKVYPDQVQTDEKGFKSVNYIEILVKKVSDLEHRIKQLEK